MTNYETKVTTAFQSTLFNNQECTKYVHPNLNLELLIF